MAKSPQLLLVITAIFAGLFLERGLSQRQICSYYGDERKSKESYSLSNCTWYRERSCCTRTEVTSTFLGMPHIATSSEDCLNHMNYMMCYFCSPDQYKWFKDGKLHICKSFCDDIFTHCKDAEYDGKSIGSRYSSGSDFCEAQFFRVADADCFEYDDKIFGSASLHQAYIHLVVVLLVINMMDYFCWT